MAERISILGSTGSIGKNTLEVIKQHPDQFEVVALAAGTNVQEMIQQIKNFKPKLVSLATKEFADQVRKEVGEKVQIVWGEEGLLEVATHPEATFLVSALVGSLGLKPTLAAIQAGKKIGLANKETLVTAGHLVTSAAQEKGIPLLPIDSEHSALFQCMNGERREEIIRLILTASGGAFRDWTREQLKQATVDKALKHPNWNMGAKVTIDSATLMNKGLEVIEAHWLFDVPYDQIDVMIHPQSIIHSMIEYCDGAVMAQLGTPDMKVPIQYALSYPRRFPLKTERLDLIRLSRLDFREPDMERFPCLRMAYEAGKIGGTMTTVLNAANEVAVENFLNHKCSFIDIEEIIEKTLEKHQSISSPSLEEIEEADQWARAFAREQIGLKW